jgi:hypothetical protein
MRVRIELSALRRTRWYEYAVRFFFGGSITLVAGLLAEHFGPVIGGLFLAFPAIFPASATLIEKHQEQKKKKAGIARTSRGQRAAALDARGAAIGTIGLVAFAACVWRLLPASNVLLVLTSATLAWFGVSVLLWWVRVRLPSR